MTVPPSPQQPVVSISGWVGQLNPSRMAPAVKTAALSIARALHQGAYART